jgi:hypothetical protein
MKKIILGAFCVASSALMAQVDFTSQSFPTSGGFNAVVDMDGDNLDDVVSASDTNIQVFHQEAGGTFTETNASTPNADNLPSWSMAAADFDRNGQTDLLYGGGNGVTFMQSNSTGTAYTEISGSEYVFSQRSNFVDINNDGHLDAFVCHDVEPNVYYMNDGSGNLGFIQGGLGDYPTGGNYGSVWIDFDNDRDVDLFIAKCGGEPARRDNEMHINNGDGTFTEIGASINLEDDMQTWSSAWADYDNDGDMDAWIGASSLGDGFHRIMRNNGDGTFTDVMTGSGLETYNDTDIENVTYDIDNDGNADIITSGNILYGNGDLTFTPVYGVGLAGSFGDLNDDGFLDTYTFGNILMSNGNSNNWLKINTVGTDSNIDGIGARVEISAASRNQIRDVRSGEGFSQVSTLNTHFGLGSDTEVTTVTIYWPSGIIDVVENVDANQTLTVVEGTTLGLEDTLVDSLIVFPNPTKEKLNLGDLSDFESPNISIFDINGRRVLNAKLIGKTIDVAHLATGNYILRIFDGTTIKTQRFIKN